MIVEEQSQSFPFNDPFTLDVDSFVLSSVLDEIDIAWEFSEV